MRALWAIAFTSMIFSGLSLQALENQRQPPPEKQAQVEPSSESTSHGPSLTDERSKVQNFVDSMLDDKNHSKPLPLPESMSDSNVPTTVTPSSK